MEVVVIAAMTKQRVIGHQKAIPWHILGEQQHFKQTTWGHPVIMGRKTFQSIGRPLPGRRNIVISRQPDFVATGCETALTLDTALALCDGAERAFIIGGEQVYRQALPLTDTVIITTIDREVDGDAFFPEFEPNFIKVSQQVITEPEPYLIEVYRRRRATAPENGL